MHKESEETFLLRNIDMQMANMYMKTYLISSYLESSKKCKSKSQWDVTSHLLAVIKKTIDNKFWRERGERESLCTIGENENLCSHYGKTVWSSSEN